MLSPLKSIVPLKIKLFPLFFNDIVFSIPQGWFIVFSMKIRESVKDLIPYSAGVKIKGVLKLASNENPLGGSPKAYGAIKKAAKELALYPDGAYHELRDSLAEHLKVKKENLIIGNGSDELITILALTYLNPKEEVVMAKETFSEYYFATQLMAGKAVQVPLVEGKHDLPAMKKAITKKTKLVFLCNPNNPTGTYFSQEELDQFMEGISEDVLVVLDEAYYEYVTAQDYPQTIPMLKKHNNLLILRTFSKVYGLAALRVGYAIASSDIINDLWKAKQPFNVGTLGQVAAKAALTDQKFVQKSQKLNAEGLKQIQQELAEMNLFSYPTETNFICVQVKAEAKEVFEKMMTKGVTIRALTGFGMTDWIRITIGTKKQNDFVMQALAETLTEIS